MARDGEERALLPGLRFLVVKRKQYRKKNVKEMGGKGAAEAAKTRSEKP